MHSKTTTLVHDEQIRGISHIEEADRSLRAFFGHHKCATGWIVDILREMCYHLGIPLRIVHRPIHFREYGSLKALVSEEKVDVLAYTNADMQHAQRLPLYRGFHVVRDPRDILVSAYFSHLHSHPTDEWPELEPHRNVLQSLSKEEGLLREMEFSREEFEQMYRWDYQQEHVLELKMEELTANPTSGFLQVARFLHILDDQKRTGIEDRLYTLRLKLNRLHYKGRRFVPGDWPLFPVPRRRVEGGLPEPALLRILREKSFSKLASGRRRGQEDVKSHYRKGQPGDWKNHFNEDHIRCFKDNYNDLLIKLGYESDPDW